MKIVKSLILVLTLTAATYAGEMVQPLVPPPPATEQAAQSPVTDILIVIVQSVLSLR